MMKKLLLTGFDPFAHYNINPSWEAVQALPDVLGGFAICRLRLPNIYGTAGRLLLEEAERIKPDVILMTGMDSGSVKVHIDTVAVNLRDALIEDNKGAKPWGQPVVPGAPAAYFATVPVHNLVTKLRRKGCLVHLGYCTGGYVCNDIFYTALHHYHNTPVKIGFIHVPLLPQMTFDEAQALPLEETTQILRQIIEELSAMLAEKEVKPEF